MLWIKALHVIFMVTWFAGVFYLPRLFVYHAMSHDAIGRSRFEVMEHKLFWYIMTPGAVLTTVFGAILLYSYAWVAYRQMGWLHAKLFLVGLLVAYHVWCGRLMHDLKLQRRPRSHIWFRWFNEVPTVVLIGVVILVVVKPF